MANKTYILIITVLALLVACKGQQEKRSSGSINELVSEIAKTNVLMGDAVGYGMGRPEQWDRYEELRSRASDNELIALTSDTNSVVRCYAFQALAARKTADIFPVVLQHLADTAQVKIMIGCLINSQKAGDIFLETITLNDKGYRLNDNQKAIIDSLLIFDNDNKLDVRNKLLLEIAPEERYYDRLRQLATAANSELLITPDFI